MFRNGLTVCIGDKLGNKKARYLVCMCVERKQKVVEGDVGAEGEILKERGVEVLVTADAVPA